MSTIKILPARPWKLASTYVLRRALVGAFYVLLGVACAVGILIWQLGKIREIRADEAIWNMPNAPRVGADVKGKVTSRWFFHTYRLDVDYDANEVPQVGKVEFDTLMDIDRSAAAEVRYDPANPKHMALSWAVNAATARWVHALFMLIFGIGLIGGGLCLGGWRTLSQLARTLRLRTDGVELYAELVSQAEKIVNRKSTGLIIYKLRVPSKAQDPDSPFTEPVIFTIEHPKKSPPAKTEAGYLMIVNGADSEGLLLDNQLHPLDVSRDDRERIIAMLSPR